MTDVDYRKALVAGLFAALGVLVVGWWTGGRLGPLFGFALAVGALFAVGNLAVDLARERL